MRRSPATPAVLQGRRNGNAHDGGPRLYLLRSHAWSDGANLPRMTGRNGSTKTLLGGHATAAFLRRYWHKDALLVRGAIPGFAGPCTRDELFALAGRDDVESRLVVRSGASWSLKHGPFRRADFRGLPATRWTLLVQGLNLHGAAADALMRRFAFLPYARLDDLMASYAAPGGGVGPHFDSYDVFLLQGPGRRRWRYGRQDDLTLKPGLPVKILKRFMPQHDAVVGPGDMLYLPPSYAHDGVAVDACITYSIGFRAPSHAEFAEAFLDHLRDDLALDGRYADPELRPSREPARVGRSMQRRVASALAKIRWDRAATSRFLGVFLSEPKPDIVFELPGKPLQRAAFARAIARRGVVLDRRTQWLYDDDALYFNGEAHAWPEGDPELFRHLANVRALDALRAASLSPPMIRFLHEGYRHGFLHVA
jgi:50S ribosomal protein L16 3-hydroxylase